MAKLQRYVATRGGWFNSPTNNVFHQFLRYTVTAGIAYSADIIILVLLIEVAGVHYLSAAAIAYMSGLILKYAISVTWVFNTRILMNKFVEFIVFAIIGVVGLGLNELLMWVFTGMLQFHYLAAKVISSGFTTIWNFSARKCILFRG